MVAAVNRLDGRQYAVKKIRMPSAAPVAYSRLMREVSTLARLQHPHVVRYFQVCTLGIPAEPSASASIQPHLCITWTFHIMGSPSPGLRWPLVGTA